MEWIKVKDELPEYEQIVWLSPGSYSPRNGGVMHFTEVSRGVRFCTDIQGEWWKTIGDYGNESFEFSFTGMWMECETPDPPEGSIYK